MAVTPTVLVTDLKIKLDEDDGLLHRLSCCQISYPFECHHRFVLYLIIYLISDIILSLTNSVQCCLIVSILHLILCINIFMECNFYIFKQSLKTFAVYYKCVNILIAMIAYHIDYNWFESKYRLFHILEALNV